MATCSALRIVTILGIVAAAGTARAEGISLSEKGDHTTEGVVIVDAPPDQVYAFSTDYGHWPQTLSDVKSVSVERGGREDARLWFDSRAFDRKILVEFNNVPNKLIRFKGIKGVPGGTARGEYRLEPVDGGKRTRVTADLYLDIKGVVGWFVSDNKTKRLRNDKLRADLTDLDRRFSHPVSSREQPGA